MEEELEQQLFELKSQLQVTLASVEGMEHLLGEALKQAQENHPDDYNRGHSQGYHEGYNLGYREGMHFAFSSINQQGYAMGYQQGRNEAFEQAHQKNKPSFS